ncbi:MAG: hypothetical protein Q9165_008792 [Trypethelium subeluteriae]
MDLFSPLETVSEHQLQTLGTVLWDWELPCPVQRLKRLSRYFEYYKETYSSYVPEIVAGPNAVAIRSHKDIFDIIKAIKTDAGIPRAELTRDYFAKRDGNKDAIPPTLDQNRAFNIAVSVMAMISSSSDRHESLLESGTRPIPWRDNMTFNEFLEKALPKTDNLLLNDSKSSEEATAIKAAISARRLKKKAGLRFVPTDDLREHLQLDRKEGVDGFDPNCLHFENASYRSEEEVESYHYFGQRLMDLYEELQNPTPRGRVEKWLERRSGARYVMLATLIGVIIAVILGLLGLTVAVFQAWVAWEQWKHPTPSG